jgi:hypothetical protein
MAVFVMAMDKVYVLRRYKSQSIFLYDRVMRHSFDPARIHEMHTGGEQGVFGKKTLERLLQFV